MEQVLLTQNEKSMIMNLRKHSAQRLDESGKPGKLVRFWLGTASNDSTYIASDAEIILNYKKSQLAQDIEYISNYQESYVDELREEVEKAADVIATKRLPEIAECQERVRECILMMPDFVHKLITMHEENELYSFGAVHNKVSLKQYIINEL